VNVEFPPFLDYVLCSGSTRISIVRPSVPHQDFYKPVREAMVCLHQNDAEHELEDMLAALTVEREKRVFPKVVTGYRKFLQGFSSVHWFEPPARDLQLGPLEVRVQPELGLNLDGRPHVLKLYLRGDPLSMDRMLFTNELLRAAFRTTWPGVVLGVLDVRRGRIFPMRPAKAEIMALLRAEAEGYYALAASLI
jgi:hypothetical protein